MSRKLKNVVMSVLIFLLIGISVLTLYYANTNSKSNVNEMENKGEFAISDTKLNEESNNSNKSNSSEPPAKPDGNNDSNNSSSNEPPAMPDENGNNSNSNEPPAKPDESNNSTKQNELNKPDNKQNSNMPVMENSISMIYYLLFIIESLAISLLVMYLILSRFNKRTLKETFYSSDRIIIYILSIVIMTSIIAFIDSYVAKSISEIEMLDNVSNNVNISYSGVLEITDDKEISNKDYSSSKKDENAVLVSGDVKVSIENSEIEKTGDSDGGDNTSFYGMNSAILAKSGANLTLKDLNITTNGVGANGVFSYGGSATTNNSSSDGTTVNISNSTITTKKDNSGGIMTTGGGITNATNLTINTSGTSSAAIRSDRGGGEVNVNKGVYTTTGVGSPAIYSTADIIVKNATLNSKASEGVVVEGKNKVELENCTLTDNNTKLNGLSTTYKNIFLYQSMSGDADTGNSSFTASNSKITTKKGDTFYVTNTSSTIELTNNTIINNDKNGNFLRIKEDSWGNKGSNGGDVKLILNEQKISGNIVVDSISTLSMNFANKSLYKGTINKDNTAKELKLKLDKSSTIKLTGNSYITSLDNEDATNSNIDFNGYKLYVNGKAIN